MALLWLLLAAGCNDAPPTAAARASAKPAPTAPAPAGLVADLYVPQPKHTWLALRTRLGGASLLLPTSLSGMLVQLLGLPLRTAQEIDEAAALVGAAVAQPSTGPQAKLGIAFAIRAKHGKRLLAQLTKGPEAKHELAPGDGGSLAWLRPRSASVAEPIGGAELAVLDHYLLVGSDRPTLERLGPYLTRNLARRPAERWQSLAVATTEPIGSSSAPSATTSASARPTHSATVAPRTRTPHKPPTAPTADLMARFEQKALRGPVQRWLAAAVDDLHSGAGATLGALVDAEAITQLLRQTLEHAGSLNVAVRIEPARAVVTARLQLAAPGEPLAGLERLDPRELLRLPDDTVVAGSWSEKLQTRRQGADKSAASLAQLLGDDLRAQDQKKLREALLDLAQGRGMHSVAGLRCTGVGVTGFALGQVEDAGRLERGLDVLSAYKRHPAVVAPLRAKGLKLSTKKLTVPDVPPEVRRFRLSPAEPAGSGSSGEPTAPSSPAEREQEPIDLLVATGKQHFWMAAGHETRLTLQRLVQPDPERSLQSRPLVAAAVASMGEQVWFVVVAEPLSALACQAGKPVTDSTGLLVLSAGPAVSRDGGTSGWLRLEAGTELLRAALAGWGS